MYMVVIFNLAEYLFKQTETCFFVLFVWETNANLLYKEKQTNFVQSSL